jgi:signal transduction histidine kinase
MDDTGVPMEWSLDRREGRGRRSYDGHDALAVRGLLHDLGHEMTTLSYLIEAIRGEPALPDEAGIRAELASLEVSRLLEMVRHALTGSETPDAVDVRAMGSEVARLATAAYGTRVVVPQGPAVRIRVSPNLLWRILANVVGNATRAAGRGGRVDVVIRQASQTIIDVIDDGPGFGAGPQGTSSLGLKVVASLLESCGGSMETRSPAAGPTRVRIVLPGQAATGAARAGAGLAAGRVVGDEHA